MALVLSRKLGETIKIGQDVEITVVSFRGGQVQLAIQAPRLVEVVRSELLHGRRLRRHDTPGKV